MKNQTQRRMKNRTQIAQLLSQSTDLGYNKTEKVLSTLLGIMYDVLACGEEISLKNFGTFRFADVSERKARNFQNGQPLTLEAHRAIRFTPCEKLRKLVR